MTVKTTRLWARTIRFNEQWSKNRVDACSLFPDYASSSDATPSNGDRYLRVNVPSLDNCANLDVQVRCVGN